MTQITAEVADPAVLAEIAEIEAIIADHTDVPQVHVPITLPIDPEARLHFTSSKFQALWRGYSCRQTLKRDKAIRDAQHLLCPLSLDIFQHPVIASDTRTYEHEYFLNGIRTTSQMCFCVAV